MIEVYHVPGSRSVRVTWLCEELEVPYRAIPVDFSPAYRASPEWRRLNPVGKVPVMRDGELTIFESGAMVEHILDRHDPEGRLRPAPGTDARALYRQWCWFSEGTFARAVGEIFNHQRVFGDAKIETVLDEMRARSRLCLSALDQAFAEQDHLLVDGFSAADVMMGYSVMIAERQQLLDDAYPRVQQYWQRLGERPAFQRATAEGVSASLMRS